MIGVNLIPSEVLVRHAVRRRIRRWGVACALLAGAAMVPVVIEARQQAQVERLKLELMDVEDKVGDLRGQLSTTAQTVLDLDAELARARALRTKRSWSGLLALLSTCQPQEVWLTSVATDPPQPKASRVERSTFQDKTGGAGPRTAESGPETRAVVVLEAPTRLRLEGFALNHERLYDLMSALKESGSFSVVELVSAGMEPVLQGRAVRFVLSCEW